jgi:hypothetical protein
MKRLLVCASLLASHAALAEPVKLGHTVGPAGLTCTEIRSSVVKASANGRNVEQKDTVAKTIEILAVGTNAVSKAKVTYTAFGKGDAIVGQTYVVTFDKGAVKLARADGKPLSPDEQKLLEKDNKRFGKPDVFAEALVGIPFEKGQKTVIPPEKLASWEEFPQPIAASMTLLERKGATGTFTVQIKAGSPGGQQLSLKGTAILDIATGRVLSLDGDGVFSDAKVTGTIHTTSTEACGK